MMDKSTVNSVDAIWEQSPSRWTAVLFMNDLFTNIQAEYSGVLDTLRFLQWPVTQRKISL